MYQSSQESPAFRRGECQCPSNVEYRAVDFIKYDDDTLECNFNEGEFPAIEADTCLSIFTAEQVEDLPKFLDNISHAARRQMLMFCRPFDKENRKNYRWSHPFLVDFTEEFLVNSIAANGFELYPATTLQNNPSLILYDFRRK